MSVLSAEVLSLSWSALGRYKLRTALSVSGVVLGVAAVIAMMSVSEGARREILEQVERLGLNNLVVRQRALSPADRARSRSRGLTVEDARRLRRLLPRVAHLTPLVERYEPITGPRGRRLTRVIGVDAEYGDVLRLAVERGRFLAPLDEASARRRCILGGPLGRELFGFRSAVGQSVRIGNEWHRVVGVLSDRASDPEKTGPLTPRDLNRAVLVPLGALVGEPPDLRPEIRVDEIWIALRRGSRVEAIADLAERTLLRLHGGTRDFEVVVPRELLRQRYRAQRTFAFVVGSVAAVSLLVGGIGIMNIMLASVLERTREIGIRRTVGARRRHITVQFLTEALLMTLTGGLAGIALGVASAFAITSWAGWSTHVSVGGVLLGFGVSLLVGVAFGLYPATRAARLDPIEAIRHE